MFFPSKISQSRSEYHLKDLLKESQPFESIPHHINELPIPLSSNRSISKVLSDQKFETMDRPATPTTTRRYSSSDIDQQSIQLIEMQQRQLIEQQKKRRNYHLNHTLFSNIYKRTHRLSSTDSHIFVNPLQRHTRRRHQSVKESDITDEPTTSDRVYSRALEKTILNPTYRTALSAPDGEGNRRTSAHVSSRQRLSSSGHTSDPHLENHSASQKMTKINVESNNRPKKISFLTARRRASYYPTGTANVLSDEQKRKRDVIWPLKRSYSFDTPFHRETIEALNKGLFENFYSKKKSPHVSNQMTNSFTEQDYSSAENCK